MKDFKLRWLLPYLLVIPLIWFDAIAPYMSGVYPSWIWWPWQGWQGW